jgi:hypothetical protein
MTAENAYQEVLGMLPEKILVNVVDSLASGEYVRSEVERLVVLSARAKEKTFTFSDKQLDSQMNVFIKTVDALNQFLERHYSLIDSAGNIFQLYPKQKHETQIKTQDGQEKSWSQLRDEGIRLGRTMRSEYEKLVALYQRKSDNGTKGLLFPYKIPAGTRWADFIFIVDRKDALTVQVKQHKVTLSYTELGMEDGRTGRPSLQWALLKLFAEHAGEIPATSSDARDNYKKQKQLLSEKLQTYFAIDFDPFEPYEGAYKAKFTIFMKDQI